MRTRTTVRAIPALFLGIIISVTTACASPQGRVYVRTPPPAAIVEVRSVAPRPGVVWIEGYHRWNGRTYVWVPGRWSAPPRARAMWVPGRWVHGRHGWHYVEGRWR